MRRLLFILLIALIGFFAVGALFLTRAQMASAQTGDELVANLEEKLALRQVPVASIQIHRDSFLGWINGEPYRVEVVLQSASEGDKVIPEDPVNIQAVARAVSLARGEGYSVDVLTIVVQNTRGQEIFWSEEPVQEGISPEQVPTSQVDEDVTEGYVREELDLYGMTLEDVVVSPNQSGDQLLTIRLSAPNIESANQSVPAFMPSLQALFLSEFQTEYNFNRKHNTRITTVIVELTDKSSGEKLLNYSLDALTGRESWWMVDDLTKDWFPHPPEE